MEMGFLPETRGWFLLNRKGCIDGGFGDAGALRGSSSAAAADAASSANAAPFAPAPAVFVHLSQEYFLIAERTCDILLNDFSVTCPSLSPQSPQSLRDLQGSRGCASQVQAGASASALCFSIAVACLGWKIPGDIVTHNDGSKTLRCGSKEELTAGVTGGGATGVAGRYMIRVGGGAAHPGASHCGQRGGRQVPGVARASVAQGGGTVGPCNFCKLRGFGWQTWGVQLTWQSSRPNTSMNQWLPRKVAQEALLARHDHAGGGVRGAPRTEAAAVAA